MWQTATRLDTTVQFISSFGFNLVLVTTVLVIWFILEIPPPLFKNIFDQGLIYKWRHFRNFLLFPQFQGFHKNAYHFLIIKPLGIFSAVTSFMDSPRLSFVWYNQRFYKQTHLYRSYLLLILSSKYNKKINVNIFWQPK